MKPSAILRYEAAIFSAEGKILMLDEKNSRSEAFIAYMGLCEKYPDNAKETLEDQEKFKKELITSLIPLIKDDMKGTTLPTIEPYQSNGDDLSKKRNYSWLVRASLLFGVSLLAAGLGVALTMTGIFAPFGIGLTTIAITGLVAAVTGTTVTALAYNIYQKSMKKKATDDLNGDMLTDESTAPSSSNTTILHALTKNDDKHNAENSRDNSEHPDQSDTRSNEALLSTSSARKPPAGASNNSSDNNKLPEVCKVDQESPSP